MLVLSKLLNSVRGFLLTGLFACVVIVDAAACDLQTERTSFSSTIEYDVYSFDRAGTTLQMRVMNTSSETCRARLALYDSSEQIASLYFAEIGLDVETIVAPGEGQASASVQSSPILIEIPGDDTTDISIDFFTDQHASIMAGEYALDTKIVVLEADSDAKLIEMPGELKLSVAPRAQINIAGGAGDFGFETFSDIVYFEEPKPGDQRRFFVQSRSNTLTTMTISSENGGKMVSPKIPDHAVHYDFVLDGQDIDLSSPWTVPDRPETDLIGISEEVIVQISEDNTPFFAGDYQDIITIEVTTQ